MVLSAQDRPAVRRCKVSHGISGTDTEGWLDSGPDGWPLEAQVSCSFSTGLTLFVSINRQPGNGSQ